MSRNSASKAIVDRVQTTSTAFLGLTMQCAQCHNHKYDPISQKEYYQFLALLNNADEPEMPVIDPDITAQRAAAQANIDKMESELESHFPTQEEKLAWEQLPPVKATARSGAFLELMKDNSILASGKLAEKDSYTVEFKASLKDVVAMRLEAMPDPSLPKNGPGRAENGNFVVSEMKVTQTGSSGKPEPIELSNATADYSQPQFDVAGLIDGKPNTGWAIMSDDDNKMHAVHTATLRTKHIRSADEVTLTVKLDQDHPLACAGPFPHLDRPRCRAANHAARRAAAQAVHGAEAGRMGAGDNREMPHWTVLDPTTFSRLHDATITKLPDHSLLYTGDNFYREQYNIEAETALKGVTAIKLEVLPHPDLPKGGPGRSHTGGFLLTEFKVDASPADATKPATPLVLEKPSADVANDKIALALDGKLDTHWGVGAGEATAPRRCFT